MSSFVVLLGVVNLALALASLLSTTLARRIDDGSSGAVASMPSVTLFVPCCGDEVGLVDNLSALLSQDYPRLTTCFVVESRNDGAVPTIDELGGKIVLAGRSEKRGQKIHNLLRALEAAEPTDVWAFADSDGRPDSGWLRRLVAPLVNDRVGVSSTYRFYVPNPVSFTTLLRSVWNASVLSLLGEHHRNFAWGGGMAIRRDVFDRIGVAAAWSGALSDDYALTHAVRRAKLTVRFAPDCLVPSYGNVGFFELLSWVTRQIKITRVYWPSLFTAALAQQSLYVGFLLLGPWAGGRMGLVVWVVVLFLGVWTGAARARRYPWVRRYAWAYATMFPIASLLTLQAALRALVSRRIEWRGRVYEMRSPSETVIIS